MGPLALPDGVSAMAARGPAWAGWVDRVPRLLRELLEEWQLAADGAASYGFCSLVVPVRTVDGVTAALKLSFDGDEESQFEHLALQRWAGDGTVQLLRADPRRRALLLERLHRQDLHELWDVAACEIVAGFYARLHVPALPQLPLLTSYVARWTERLDALPRAAPLPRRLVEQAVSLGHGFVTDTDSVGTMIHGDLHYANVLAADREPWLVIDPKPISGDPHYEVAPLLWNRADELGEGYRGIRDGVRLRFHTVVDAAGLDEDRSRAWVVVRVLHNALWELEDADQAGRAPRAAYLTTQLTIAKAVQD